MEENNSKIKSNKIICKECNTKNSIKREYCYMCGKYLDNRETLVNNDSEDVITVKKKVYKQWWFWACIILLCFIIFLVIDSQRLKTISLDKQVYNIGIYEEIKPVITTNLEDNSKIQYTWAFEDESIAKINENGNITGLKEGSTTVTVKGNNRVTSSAEVIVKYITLTNIEFEHNKYMEVGDKQTLNIKYTPENASNKNIYFESSNTSVVSVNEKGEIMAVATGKATVKIKASDGIEKKIDITVYNKVKEFDIKESSITIYKGKNKTINLTISPKNAQNTPVKWMSSDTYVATVDSKGKVTGKADGTAIITAVCEANGTETSVEVIVKEIFAESIKVTGSKSSMKKGDSITLKATVSPNNTTDKSVTWTSSNTSVATVSNGKVTAKGKGNVTITAETSNGIKKEIDIIVKEKAPIQITQFNDKMDMYGGVTWTVNLKNTSKKTIDWLTIKWYCFNKSGSYVYDRYDNKNYMKLTFVDALNTLKSR